jgi:hypothetical protein
MAQKSSEGATAEIREQGDGAEDEEWVCRESHWPYVSVGVLYTLVLVGVGG